ncbi:hypothetical protein TSTA_042110 [Talaromyces stipitatus ATCC 10500]|uniref:Integrase catalytic domain-containing protein n=1 Tax=Talaromyces stipitatus (strain ATCC 10500 / CBS 375.48 / QM 6759 / NRRL 1006) TaxID=441959 RepID=B8MJR9_TALSN|nr:uncharacterized protein TSTA_042110 [Talaromyces stipitatus ATCC 10500]EED14736.1 hypothetical protein TSTA_042110 [Talaromyces stipitatus ATCC 10500]
MKADSHPPVLERCSKSFDRVHADLIPLDGISLGGSKYMLLLVDDYTRYVWYYFASSKNVPAITPLLQGFINLVLTQFNANGVLERRVQTIKNMERSMRAGAGVLDDYRLQAESLATSSLALQMDSQPIYNPRGSVVFGTCVKIHEHDTTRELVEAALIVQGMESLSCPPWQTAERIQTDHNGDPLSYSDALLQDPIRWPPAVQEELKSHEENGT